MQAFVLLAMLITARKALKLAQEQIEELRTNVMPVVKDTKQLLLTVGPKIESVASDFAALTHGLRTHGIKLEESATDILERVDRQSNRVDTMLTNMLDTVDRAVAVVAEVLSVPLRQLAGVAAFARAAISTLRGDAPYPQSGPQPTHSPADKDLFV
jgi:MarR-like DNA-binding transcriptional regulator SgrR of sgrS sRNA